MIVLKSVEIEVSQGRVVYPLKVIQKVVERVVLRHQGITSLEKNREESIRIDIRKDLITVNLFLVFNLERRVPEVAWELQKNLKETIEKKTGLKVEQIHIYVQGFDSRRMDFATSLGYRNNILQ